MHDIFDHWKFSKCFYVVFAFQLLVQVNITGLSCEEPDFLIYQKIFIGEEKFTQCILEQNNNFIFERGGERLLECSFRCGGCSMNTEAFLFMQIQIMPWLHNLDHSHAEICGLSIQNYRMTWLYHPGGNDNAIVFLLGFGCDFVLPAML